MVTRQTVRFNVKATHVKESESAVIEITKALREATICGIRYTMPPELLQWEQMAEFRGFANSGESR